MDGKRTGVMLGVVMLLSCGGVLLCVGGGATGYHRYQSHLQDQQNEAYCLVVRERTREIWLATTAALSEQREMHLMHIAEHESAKERATLIRDLETIDRYERMILTAENHITSLNLALEAVSEMQTALVTLPPDEVVRKAALIAELPWDEGIQSILDAPLQATLALQEDCAL